MIKPRGASDKTHQDFQQLWADKTEGKITPEEWKKKVKELLGEAMERGEGGLLILEYLSGPLPR